MNTSTKRLAPTFLYLYLNKSIRFINGVRWLLLFVIHIIVPQMERYISYLSVIIFRERNIAISIIRKINALTLHQNFEANKASRGNLNLSFRIVTKINGWYAICGKIDRRSCSLNDNHGNASIIQALITNNMRWSKCASWISMTCIYWKWT